MLYRRRYSVTASSNDFDWPVKVLLNAREAFDASIEIGWSHKRSLGMRLKFAGSNGKHQKKKITVATEKAVVQVLILFVVRPK